MQLPIVISLVVVFCLHNWLISQPRLLQRYGEQSIGCDFRMWYEAAKGNYDFEQTYGTLEHVKYYYVRIAAYGIWPLTLFPFKTAWPIWFAILSLSYVCIAYILTSRRKYGWVVAILGLYPFGAALNFGNPYPLLALLCFDWLPLLVACLVKPVFLVVPLVGAGRRMVDSFHYWKATGERERSTPFDRGRILLTTKEIT